MHTLLNLNKSRPVTLNSVLGFTLTLIHVYTAEQGFWTRTSIANAALTTCTGINALLLYLWHAVLARKALEEHLKATLD